MTLLGKIFTVLVLFMSVVFMSFAIMVYATHVNWREVVDNANPGAGEQLGYMQRVAQAEETNKQLREDLEAAQGALSVEQAARRFAIAALRTKLEDAEQTLRDREKELENLQTAHGQLVETERNTAAELTKLTAEVEKLREEVRIAQQDRDEQFQQVVALTDEVHGLQGTRRSLEERHQQLVAQNTQMKGVLAAHGLNENDSIELIPPALDGFVMAVSDKDLLEVSIGSDDGLKEGHLLDVFRGNTYLGRVVVRRTGPDRAVAEIIKEFRKGIIKKGDRVATKLI